MPLKRDKVDDIFSKLVRALAGWTCEKCGKYFPEDRRQGLHCSHFFSRRHKSTRWDINNAAAHCYSCHQRLGGNPVEFAEWIENHIGREKLEHLRLKAHRTVKLTKADKEEIYQDLKRQYQELMDKRNGN